MSGLARCVRSLVALLGLASAAAAQDKPAIARFVPPAPDSAHVFVLDSAHILSAATIAALQDSARALQAETRADVAWITLPTLGGRPIEEAALYIGRTWRIGSPGQPGDPLRNRGLVVLYIPDKTQTSGPNFRIEVGNGLEGTITDSRSRTITTAMRDDLRAKQYDAAYLKGWDVAARLVREDFAAASRVAAPPAPKTAPAPKNNGGKVLAILFLSTVGLVVMIGIVFSSRRRAARPRTMGFQRRDSSSDDLDDDDVRSRRVLAATLLSMQSGSSSSSSSDSSGGGDSGGDSGSSSSSSDSGSFGDGGGFSGGGSSDTI
jgi:uncharacterized protein